MTEQPQQLIREMSTEHIQNAIKNFEVLGALVPASASDSMLKALREELERREKPVTAFINVADLAATILKRLDTDSLELGSRHEMGKAHYRGIPSLMMKIKWSDILRLAALQEAIADALHEQGVETGKEDK
jgi:hypothetical protein